MSHEYDGHENALQLHQVYAFLEDRIARLALHRETEQNEHYRPEYCSSTMKPGKKLTQPVLS